jgi:hypothetical protein
MKNQSNIQQRLLASAGTPTAMDIGSILRRLLLFETVILYSNRLQEIPALVNALGYDQTLELLGSGILRIHCHQLLVTQTGQAGIARSNQKPLLPLGSYCITTFQTADQKLYVRRCFKEIEAALSLPIKKFIKLKQATVAQLETPPTEIIGDTISQSRRDILYNPELVRKALTYELQKQLSTSENLPNFKLGIVPIDEEDFRVEGNIQEVFLFEDLQTHKVIELALLSIGGINLRIAEMKGFNALSGFQEGHLPLFDDKLSFLTNSFDPEIPEKRFGRIVKLLSLPDFTGIGTEYKLNMDKFLKVRSSQECQLFRSWLSNIDKATDAEIVDQMSGVRAQIAAQLNRPLGKAYGKKTQPRYKWAKQLSLSVTAESLCQLGLTIHC